MPFAKRQLFTHLKIETVRRSFTVVMIAFPQLKCTSNEGGNIQKLQSRARVARLYAITIKASWACTFLKQTRCSCKTFAE